MTILHVSTVIIDIISFNIGQNVEPEKLVRLVDPPLLLSHNLPIQEPDRGATNQPVDSSAVI